MNLPDASEWNWLPSDPEYRRYMASQVNLDFTHDVPYVAGYSIDGKTIYFDRHMPRWWRGIYIPQYLLVHERTEKFLIDRYGLDYQQAHHLATHFEHAAVVSAGISWRGYSRFFKPYIKADEHEKIKSPPPDLDLTPYKDEKDSKLLRVLLRGQKHGRSLRTAMRVAA